MMKKIMLFAAACAALVACSKEVIDNGKTGEKDGQMILSASFDGGTKVAPDDDDLTASTVTFKWEEGDKIYITPTGGSELEFTVVNNTIIGSTASFSGTSFDVANGYSVEYRGSTSFTDGSFKPYAKASDCTASSFTLTMQPVLKLQLKGTAAISRIQYGESNEFTFSTALQLSSTVKDVYLPLNGEFEDGIALKFYDANQTSNRILVMNTAALASGNIYTMPDLTVNAYPTVSYYEGGTYCGDGIQIGSVIWAPVNCGYDATHTYGLLYQWGRKDGQGYDTGEGKPTIASMFEGTNGDYTGSPALSSTTFYKKGSGSTYEYDWIKIGSNDYWNSGSEASPCKTSFDPCPTGWRVPTVDELGSLCYTDWNSSDKSGNTKRGSWNSTSKGWDFGNVFLPAAGYLYCDNGNPCNRDYSGSYWSSSVKDNTAWGLGFGDCYASIVNDRRADGGSVRCVQE